MTRKQHFADSFWDSDFNKCTGFEVLVKKLKDGRQMCKDFEDFLRQRAKIEENYSKELHRLARHPGGSTEIGSLRTSWDSMKSHLDTVAQEHSELSKAVNEAAARVADFKKAQKTDFRKDEATVRTCLAKKQEQFRRTQESKRVFEKASSDAESIKQQVQQYSNSGQISRNPADMSKLYSKQVKAEEDASRLNHTYKEKLTKLEEFRIQWEKFLTHACNVFESLEEQRLEFLRNELWSHVNAQSVACVRIDDNNEEVRISLLKCDPDDDIVRFINDKSTGSTKPAQIQYDANNRQMAPRPHGAKSPQPMARFVQPVSPNSGHTTHHSPFSVPSVTLFKK